MRFQVSSSSDKNEKRERHRTERNDRNRSKDVNILLLNSQHTFAPAVSLFRDFKKKKERNKLGINKINFPFRFFLVSHKKKLQIYENFFFS